MVARAGALALAGRYQFTIVQYSKPHVEGLRRRASRALRLQGLATGRGAWAHEEQRAKQFLKLRHIAIPYALYHDPTTEGIYHGKAHELWQRLLLAVAAWVRGSQMLQLVFSRLGAILRYRYRYRYLLLVLGKYCSTTACSQIGTYSIYRVYKLKCTFLSMHYCTSDRIATIFILVRICRDTLWWHSL